MRNIKIPKNWLYSSDNSHTVRDDEILMQVQGTTIRRSDDYDARMFVAPKINDSESAFRAAA